MYSVHDRVIVDNMSEFEQTQKIQGFFQKKIQNKTIKKIA